ncbi:MAG TPA: YraN family protein [Thermoleophilaceae bacterium]|jgi:putative endonuclease
MTNDPRRGVGARGEQLAADHLAARGYELLERNYRTRYGELDIVARDGRVLVFCEVKARLGAGPIGPLAAVGPRKRSQLRRMAGQWLHERGPVRGTRDVRFDVVGINLDAGGRVQALDHMEGAF